MSHVSNLFNIFNASHGDELRSFLTSSLMITVSEIGDKTFLVAAVMSMSQPRLLVFISAWSALVLMSVLSAFVGTALPTLLSRTVSQFLAGILFFMFGCSMIAEARNMRADESINKELSKVQSEIAQVGNTDKSKHSPNQIVTVMHSVVSNVLSPLFIKTFVLTFLAEWGDRSQIATIVMAASGNTFAVIIGTVFGHAFCTGLAVVGGRMLATRISVRAMTHIGGLSFILFGCLSFWFIE